MNALAETYSPTIISITPTQTTAGTFDLTINGNNFDSGAVDQIYWKADGHLVGHGAIKSRTSSRIVVTESMAGATLGVYVIKVKNSDGKESNGVELTINAPTPQITLITPTQTTAGTFDLTIYGNNFDSGAVDQIYWKADGHFVGSGTVKSRTSSKIVVTQRMTGTEAGVYVIKVKNSDGMVSNGKELTISAPAPQEGSLVQVEGSPEVYLIENGMKRHFTSPEALEWNGYSFSDVTDVSSETLASIPAGTDITISQPIIDKYHVLGGMPIFGASSGEGEKIGDQDSAGIYCSYVNFENGAIECFKGGSNNGEAYAIFNPFYIKWASMGCGKSVLGYPISDMSNVQTSKFGTQFRYQNFANGTENGALEYNLDSGEIFEIHGAIFAKWGALGYADSVLGLVTSDERNAVPSSTGTTGRVSDFENGHLHWHSNGDHYMDTYVTYGELDTLYVGMRGTAGDLGFPIMDQEEIDGDGHGFCEFEGGSIYWDDSTGAYKVKLGSEGSLLRAEGSLDVYLIKNGMKCHFTLPEALEWNGYSFDNVMTVTNEFLQKYADGGDISISQPIIDKYHELGGESIFGASAGDGEKTGDQDSAGIYCSYVNFENGAIECFKEGPNSGKAYAIFNPFYTK